MPGKIFISYRREDVAGDARGIRDAFAAKFGRSSVFMDVDDLLAGRRFDVELARALDACDVLIAVIGPRWLDLLNAKTKRGERDFVRAEIAAALERGIVVVPVRVGSEGRMPPLPRDDELPEDIRALVMYQKHDVAHERFGRDVADLILALRSVRRPNGRPMPWVKIAAAAAAVIIMAGSAWYFVGQPEKQHPIPPKAEKKPDVAIAPPLPKPAPRPPCTGVETLVGSEKRCLQPSDSFKDCSDVCPEMVVVPAGSFTMGSNEYNSENPPRKVTIQRSFAVGKFEVTFAEWDACVAAGGCKHNPGDQGWGWGRRPVINVSWHDAKEYAAWLSRKTGKAYRLLSEAEWEYAARAGTTTRYAFGDTISKSQAQYSASKTVEVGSFSANKFGLHDLHGNVWEWVEDAWHANYEGAPIDGSVWSGGDTSLRVLRGGSWVDIPGGLRSAIRYWVLPVVRYGYVGFRLARTL